ncbi:MAG: pyridoxal-phosphate dependent enzyme [Candidatus Hydrogenedentota bacterium]
MTDNVPDLNTIREAALRIDPYILKTPVHRSENIDRKTGARVFFKCENFQKAGAFKMRGAANAVFGLSDEEAAKGVATHSSGNHAGAIARAAQLRGIPAYIVMPSNVSVVKRDAAASYGATIIEVEPGFEHRITGVERAQQETGAKVIPPFDDYRIIAGQGTVALELMEEIPDLDIVIAPVGGGGLLSGTCIAAKGLNPDVVIYGAEPELADDAFRSLQTGSIQPVLSEATIADGLRTGLCERTFSIIRNNVEAILTVSDDEIVDAMRFVWERMKIVIEPSAAVPVAALFRYPERFAGKRVGLIVSGGNVDLSKLPWD